MELTSEALDAVVRAALAEDVGEGDLTTEGVVPADLRCRAELVLEEPGVVSGVPAARAVFHALDSSVRLESLLEEGSHVREVPARLAEIEGPARAILTGERTALNLLGRLCGIATLTARYVGLVEGTGTTILDTRKTTPGLRSLEKYAVRCGGGVNHRLGLHDAILLKENHLRIAGGIGPAVAALRNGRPTKASLVDADQKRPAGSAGRIEVEAETLAEVAEALESGVERILLDNMTPKRFGAPSSSSPAEPSSRPPAASRSGTCAPTPRPASTSSPSAR